ncbi:ribonuclease H-like domain-containing protein [Tanacetum coccineum]
MNGLCMSCHDVMERSLLILFEMEGEDVKRILGVFLALLVYVDDIIITGNSIFEIDKFKVFLNSKFMINDLGKLKLFLGIEYGMLACKPTKTPLMSKLAISNEATDDDHILHNIIDYHKLMGELIYLTNTRPDISYVKSKKQNTLSKSSTEAEYRALASVINEIVVNPVFHKRTKHVEIALPFVREKILSGAVKTVKVDSANQIADILTKGLDTLQPKVLVEKLGMFDIYQVLMLFVASWIVGGSFLPFADSY